MKVLHVAESITGGVSTYLNLMDECLKSEGDIEAIYFVPLSQRDNLNVDSHKLYFHGGKRSVFGLFLFFYQLVLVLKKKDPDVVYAHSSFAGFFVSILKLFKRDLRMIYCPHGWAVFRKQSKLKMSFIRYVERILSLIPDKIVNISRFEHDETLKMGYGGNRLLITNTVTDCVTPACDFVKDTKTSSRPFKLLFVGRFDYQKGLDILIEALNSLNSSVINYELKVIGGGVLNNTRNVDMDSPWIHNLGWVNNSELDVHYQGADVLVVPSRWEGFGLVVLEAYKNSTPVLVSSCGALPSLVDEELTGYISDASVEGFVSSLKKLNLEKLSTMRPLCRNKYEVEFSVSEFKKLQIKVLNGIYDE